MCMMDAISFDSLRVRSMCMHIRLMKNFGCSKIGVRPTSVMPAFRVRRGSYLIHEPAGGIDSAGPCAQSVAVFSAFFSHMVCLYMWRKQMSRIFFEHPLIYNVEASWRPRSSACCRNCIQPPRRAARPPLFRQKIFVRYFNITWIYKIYSIL